MDSQFRILGPIEVELPGGRIAGVPRGRARSLLALLLVHRGAIVSPDRVVDELWGDAGPRNARNAVQVVASRLRAAVGDGVVVSDAGGYAVRRWPGALDADRFEERFRRGRDALARGDPQDAAETLGDALRLWRGPALADVRDEAFARPEIARLDDLRLACLSERVDADWPWGGTPTSPASWRRWCWSTRSASGSAASSCPASIAPTARRTRWRRTAPPAPPWSTGSASNRRWRCGSWRRPSSVTMSPRRRRRGRPTAPAPDAA